jgi:GT2 family glycosyltransferase
VPVSVVIPTFNRRELVRQAVASVCAQRAAECEIIVVDDGSADGTAEALRAEFGAQIRLIRTENRGVAAARNLGVASSRGELIAFLDSDDLWLPDKVAAQLAFCAEHPGAAICQTEEIWMRNGVRVNPCAHHRKPSGDIFEPSLRLCLVSPSAVMLRRSLFEGVGGFDESLAVCEDYDLWLRIARNTPVWLVDRALVVKRGGHADQLSHQLWGMDRFRVAALVRLLAQGDLSPVQHRATLAVLAEKCQILAQGAARRGRHAEAEAYRALPASNSLRKLDDVSFGSPLPRDCRFSPNVGAQHAAPLRKHAENTVDETSGRSFIDSPPRGSVDFLANSASTSSARAVGYSISKENSAHPENLTGEDTGLERP